MQNITIALPEPLKTFVDEQAAQCGLSNPGAYVEQLIREAQQRQTFEEVERSLQKGIESGEPERVTEAHWDAIRERVRQHHRKHAENA